MCCFIRSLFAVTIIGIGCIQQSVADETPGNPETVHIIEFGGIPGTGGQPSPSQMAEKVQIINQLPVQGVTFNISNEKGYFVDKCMTPDIQYTYEDVHDEVELMKRLELKRGMQFFLRLNIASLLQTDWFDDGGWEVILNNIKVASRAAAELGQKGFLVDNEQYNYQPFNYTAQANRVAKSFSEYEEQVRKRGRQFAEALTSHVPDPAILMLFGNSHIAKDNWKKEKLDTYLMGLWPAFLDGMMDASVDAEFIDGHEDYSAETYEYFHELRRLVKEGGAVYSADPDRYRKRIRAAFPIWLKSIDGIELQLDADDFTKNRYTPEEFEYALHYAMLNSDGYVWLYSVPWLNLPTEYTNAIQAARKPHRLDFDFTRGKPKVAASVTPPDQLGLTISAKHRLDNDDKIVFEPMRRVYREIYDFPKKWKFKFDPNDLGQKEQWYAKQDLKEWADIEIGDWYGAQLDSVYTGYCWYQIAFDVPREWEDKKLLLAFGAVDEMAWIWVNGVKAGESTSGPHAWNSAFEIDISNYVRPGQSNSLVVRVHNAVGPGGIWKSVKIFSD